MTTRPFGLVVALVCACSAGSVSSLYTGTYLYTWADETGATTQREGAVTLELRSDGLYRLFGEVPDHPPAREGRYRETDGGLVLIDTTDLVAGYPLHLIVDGHFSVAADGPELVLIQGRSDGGSRILLLRKRH